MSPLFFTFNISYIFRLQLSLCKETTVESITESISNQEQRQRVGVFVGTKQKMKQYRKIFFFSTKEKNVSNGPENVCLQAVSDSNTIVASGWERDKKYIKGDAEKSVRANDTRSLKNVPR